MSGFKLSLLGFLLLAAGFPLTGEERSIFCTFLEGEVRRVSGRESSEAEPGTRLGTQDRLILAEGAIVTLTRGRDSLSIAAAGTYLAGELVFPSSGSEPESRIRSFISQIQSLTDQGDLSGGYDYPPPEGAPVNRDREKAPGEKAGQGTDRSSPGEDFRLARISLMEGNLAEADLLLSRLLESGPEELREEYLFFQAYARTLENRQGEALSLLRRIRKPETLSSPAAYLYLRGKLEEECRNLPEAIRLWQKFLESYPRTRPAEEIRNNLLLHGGLSPAD